MQSGPELAVPLGNGQVSPSKQKQMYLSWTCPQRTIMGMTVNKYEFATENHKT